MTRHALVVGINQYPFLQDTSTSKAKSLKTPAGDAEAITQLLEADDNFQVRRLPSSKIDGKLQVDPNKVEVKQTPKGLCARSIRVIDDFDSFIS